MSSNITVTIYSKPSCVQCNATYRAFDRKGVNYGKPLDLTQDEASLEMVKGLGHQQAPVVVIRQDGKITHHWSGFQPDQINAAAELVVAHSIEQQAS